MISVKNQRAPLLNKKVRSPNQGRYCWRICPYSTEDITSRTILSDKSIHTTTSGRMTIDVRAGHDGTGWVCLDPACSYFLGTAVSGIAVDARVQQITASGGYQVLIVPIQMGVCSGTQFFEM